MKTLRSKLISIYILLVLIIGMIGGVSVYNSYKLSRSINGLMVDNYKSINAARQMVEAIEGQNLNLLDYIYTGNKASLKMFYSYSSNFYKWYNTEANNITEKGENSRVNTIHDFYLNYMSVFPEVQKIKDTNGETMAVKFYNSKIRPEFISLIGELKNLTTLNENAMFESKQRVTESATRSVYLLIVISAMSILMGFLIAIFSTNRFLKPLYRLKKNMSAVKEGQIQQEVVVTSDDEIGELTIEFNNMIKRLQIFEKSTKGKLLEEKNRSLAIVKSISDPLIVLDTDYKVLLVNNAAEQFFEIKEKECFNKYFLEVIRNGDIFDHITKAYTAKEERYVPKIINLTTNNKEFYFDTLVTKVRDQENVIKGVVVLFQNITKLKKLEKVKTEFVSNISHEFKTPLTSIMMGTSLLKNQGLGNISAKQSEIISTIEDDAEKLSVLVNDIIHLSKAESESDMYYFEECSIDKIVNISIKMFNEQAVSKDIKIYFKIEENLPPVIADHEKLTWVVNNLLSNSIKFTGSGGVIEINSFVKLDELVVSIKDNGIGIPDDYTEKIFEKFIQVDRGNSEMKGSGIGLSIAREIVEKHKGRIWCESNRSGGATFTFTLPLGRD
jgi:PAS domain S-box-containing protein